MLDRCFRSRSSKQNPWISPLTCSYEYPRRLFPFKHYLICRTNNYNQVVNCYSKLNCSKLYSLLWALQLLSVTEWHFTTQWRTAKRNPQDGKPTLLDALSYAPVEQYFPEFQLRAFQLQQFWYLLLELELPRLLAPDLPSNWSFLRVVNCSHSNTFFLMEKSLLIFVTSSLVEHWEICAPAAFLRCSSRLSGSFSGVKPLFPVTRKRLSSTIHSIRNLMRKRPNPVILRYESIRIRNLSWITKKCWFKANKCRDSEKPLWMHD